MFSRKAVKIVIFSNGLALMTSASRGQDACIALLQHSIYDTHAAQGSTQSFGAFRSTFCSWYSSYRQTNTSAGASLSIPIADIPLGISGNYTYGEADTMSKALCSNQAATSSSDQSWQQIDQTLNPGGTQAFTECVKALHGGLGIDFRVSDDETQLALGLSYAPPVGAPPGATLNLINNDGWICAAPPTPQRDLHSIAGKTGQLTNNQMGLTCNRDIKPPFLVGGQKVVADKARLALQTSAGLFTVFFRPKVYEEPIADTAKVLESYPKGTILLFAGPRATIPAGWHICDGQSGTVNLIAHAPWGADADSALGTTAGSPTHAHTYSGRTAKPTGQDNPHVVQDGGSALNVKGVDHTHDFSGTTSTESNIPPITRVYFIQKID